MNDELNYIEIYDRKEMIMSYSKCRVFAVLAAVMMTGTLAVSAYAANPESVKDDRAMEARLVESDVAMPNSDGSVFDAELDPGDTIDSESIDSELTTEARSDEADVAESDSNLSVFNAELADPATAAFAH